MPEQPKHTEGAEWSQATIADLRAVIKAGATIEGAAAFLCRSTDIAEVEAKARELGLPIRHA